ncbi:MAG: hypothetical protein ACRDMV_21070, partial [Streptosporangiales bacterium]
MIRRGGALLVAILVGVSTAAIARAPAAQAQAHVRWMPGSLREVLNAGPGFYTYAPSVIAS